LAETYFKFRIKYGTLFGEVYATSPNIEGVAVWIPSEYVKMTCWRMILAGVIPLIRKFNLNTIKKIISSSDFS